jgi:hypothetical protein
MAPVPEICHYLNRAAFREDSCESSLSRFFPLDGTQERSSAEQPRAR